MTFWGFHSTLLTARSSKDGTFPSETLNGRFALSRESVRYRQNPPPPPAVSGSAEVQSDVIAVKPASGLGVGILRQQSSERQDSGRRTI